MIWKIILLLSCFHVLVNAGGNCSGGTSAPTPHRTIADWKNELVANPVLNWDHLICFPKDDDKEAVVRALIYSGCPTESLQHLLDTSHWNTWPIQIKSADDPFISKTNMNRLSLYRILNTRVVYVANSQRPVKVNFPGLIFIFNSI
ncbi:E3 ubiquitin-protein ligase NRDP1-like [Adelges cooleyi]|uniref:E3 ubiquitin-protein ligase NRDP1-like n=1 Tax=Adelges cooleyi TaxID=133065 RepID=UPI00217F9B91|nr:E3 ubiquitin-protein ligase NRDP1-like [Adelges cooleyi]